MSFLDVSAWQSKISSTKGTRDKGLVFEPNTGDTYFIKFPMLRENRDYSMETWSEIIAYKVGTLLGFNVLRYDFALYKGRAGCISKNMVEDANMSLVEGESILMSYDPTYNPSDKASYSKYTFSFVEEALGKADLGAYVGDFIKILVFDAIIGNSDRHQSNWGFIQKITAKEERTKYRRGPFGRKAAITRKFHAEWSMSPIYDSGCCLGREFSEEQVMERLSSPSKFTAFISKGVAELRADSAPAKKQNHFDLLRYIMGTDKRKEDFVQGVISDVLIKYERKKVHEIIADIDADLPSDIRTHYGLSDNRKVFIERVIDTRIEELKKIRR